jgi:hypothetical protein
MTVWNLYFILKLYLFAGGHLQPLWLVNLGFALALAASSTLRHRGLRVLRNVLGLAIGLPLMYHEANVPPFSRLTEEFGNLTTFSFGYWLELAQRFVPPMLLLAALGGVVGYLIVNRWLRVATFVLIALVAMPLWHEGSVVLAGLHRLCSRSTTTRRWPRSAPRNRNGR